MSARPVPLVPAEVDLRSLEYMPLYIATLFNSKTWLLTKRKPELMRPLLALWLAAWQSVPAGSIEADDDVMADAAELGFEPWIDMKDDLLRGWKLCSDGRYYLPSMVPMVMRGWALVTGKRKAGKAGAKARWGDSSMAPAMPPAIPSENGREGGSKVVRKEKGGATGATNGEKHPRIAFLEAYGQIKAGLAVTDPIIAKTLDQLNITTAVGLTDRQRDFEREYQRMSAH